MAWSVNFGHSGRSRAGKGDAMTNLDAFKTVLTLAKLADASGIYVNASQSEAIEFMDSVNEDWFDGANQCSECFDRSGR